MPQAIVTSDQPVSTPARRRGCRGFILGFAIMLLYVGVRALIYSAVPDDVPGGWIATDTMMDLPRLLCFALALVVGLKLWGRRGLGLHADRVVAGIGIGAASVVLGLLGNFSRAPTAGYPAHVLAVLAVSSLIVALHEELVFRGVIFTGLRDWLGSQVAIWISSVLFVVYHVQAQPLAEWPTIFLFGVLYAVLRDRGVGLWWLILAHAALDALVFLTNHGEYGLASWPYLIFGIQALFVVGCMLMLRRPEGADPTLAPRGAS